ncbi:10962_t:CDS:1, partial [Racocetra persica]
TLEKPGVEVFSSPYSPIEELSQKARALAKNSVSPFYKAQSEKYWGLYKEFCKGFEVNEKEPSEDGILAFIMWLDISGLASQTSRIMQAVTNNLRFEGKEDFRKSLAITQVLRAVKKEATKDKTPDWPRDPLLVGTLRYYVD